MDLTGGDLVTIGLLIALEGVLSADNALVIAIMVLGLPQGQHKKALHYGLVGAFTFRVAATLLAIYLIRLSWVKLLGGVYLLYLTWSHFAGGKSAEERRNPPKATPWLGMSAFWATVVRVEMVNLAFSIDSILVAVAMSPKRTVVLAGGILGIVALRLVVVQLLSLIQRYPALVDGAFVVIAWVGIKLVLEFLFAVGYVHFEFPRWLSLGIIVVILAIAFVYARLQGPAEVQEDNVNEQATELLSVEDEAIDATDGTVHK